MIFFLFTLLFETGVSDPCRDNSIWCKSRCYEQHEFYKTWYDAEQYCRKQNRTLVTGTQAIDPECMGDNSGWVGEIWETSGYLRDGIQNATLTENYCIYTHLNPINPSEVLVKFGDCSKKLPIICITKYDSASYHLNVTRMSYSMDSSAEQRNKYCSDVLVGSQPFNIRQFWKWEDYSNKLKEIKVPAWTSYYMNTVQPFDIKSTVPDAESPRNLKFGENCGYNTGRGVFLSPCTERRTFTCVSVVIKDTTEPDGDDDKQEKSDVPVTYSCNTTNEMLCQTSCYNLTMNYKTWYEAEKECSDIGSTLATTNLTCVGNGYHGGWINGKIDEGVIQINDTKAKYFDDLCIYYFNGQLKYGDCYHKAYVICSSLAEDGNCKHPEFKKCTGSDVCLGTSQFQTTWEISQYYCGKFWNATIFSNVELEQCRAELKQLSDSPAWLGFKLSQLRQVQSVSTGDILMTAPELCSFMVGGRLKLAECSQRKYYTCEHKALATYEVEYDGRPLTAIIITICVLISICIDISIVVMYKKYKPDIFAMIGRLGRGRSRQEQDIPAEAEPNIYENPLKEEEGEEAL